MIHPGTDTMLGFRNYPSEIGYIYSADSTAAFDKLPSNLGRSSMVHSLITALGLFEKMMIYAPKLCDSKFLQSYHSEYYIEALFSNRSLSIEELEDFGLLDDCSKFDGLQNYGLYLGGSVLSTLKALEEGCRFVINWDGGRHHAQASQASGFCFINDVNLLILGLQEDYDKILYVDLDLHHGDGVENAFIFSDKVFTLSIHKFFAGFFPGTGTLEDVGKGKGIGKCLNLPISQKINGSNFYELFCYTMRNVMSFFDPDIIVCVCGADILSDDPHAGFNVGSHYYSKCVEAIVRTDIPIVFLGGGGYNHQSTSKLWATLTHKIVSSKIDVEDLPDVVPEHDYWPVYAQDDALVVKEKKLDSPENKEELEMLMLHMDKVLEF